MEERDPPSLEKALPGPEHDARGSSKSPQKLTWVFVVTYRSSNQFSKATKRWGFYKQPRQVQRRTQPSEPITKEEEAPNPLEDLFDFEPDVLDTIDENEAYLGSGDENVADSQILEDVQGQFSDTGKSLVSEPPPSLNHSQPLAMDAGFPCEASPVGTDKSLPESSNRQSEQLKAAPKLETVLHSIISKMFTRVSLDDLINKSRVDYLTCCYFFEEAVGCLERSGKSVDNLEHQVPRSDTDKLFAKSRRDTDKILASPDSSLDMWSILCLLEVNQCHNMDNLLDRLDITDLQFMTAVRGCQWVLSSLTASFYTRMQAKPYRTFVVPCSNGVVLIYGKRPDISSLSSGAMSNERPQILRLGWLKPTYPDCLLRIS
ncbi:hypothetical protein FMEXI_11599 [Fusarium mexicanum]|uniref:Uncharacterized protein n=1 Tax=Fusarium mexicanum TaxID=751941 RepID=A0A8H5IB65_9HYPO|nr:hypothetical protein FMEXI_11599 [Fusarium mexicanum]